MERKVNIYIETEKGSNINYEINKETNKLEVDRILPDPYSYPYSHGFIEKTLTLRGDELDALIISEKNIANDKFYEAYIIGMLNMTDEKGKYEKILCVLEEDYSEIDDLNKLSDEIKENINKFFANYKSDTPNIWAYVSWFENKAKAIQTCELYEIKEL